MCNIYLYMLQCIQIYYVENFMELKYNIKENDLTLSIKDILKKEFNI